MKILYYHQYFHTPKSASAIRSYQMARALIKAGHSVTMVCGTSDLRGKIDIPSWKPGVKRGLVDGIDVIQFDIRNTNYCSLVKRSWNFFRFALKSSLLAFTEDYDILFASSTPLTAAIPGIFMKTFRQKPFVFEVRDLWPELPRAMGVIKNPIILAGMSVLEWLAYRSANACIGLSPGIVDGIRKRGKKDLPVAMIPNAADLDLFIPGERTALQMRDITDQDFAAVFMGAHGIANGLDAVLLSGDVLQKRSRTDIKLVLIGDGREKPRLVKKAQDMKLKNVLFVDLIPKVELATMLGCFDAGMMVLDNVPAFYYGTSPNKFFDYLSAGLPVINNYPGWLADLISENHCGIAVPPDDHDAFADALENLADNPGLVKVMGKNARKLAEDRFARDKMATEFVEWLETFGSKHV